MKSAIRTLESPSAEDLLDADVSWWLEAAPEERILAVDEARRDLERMGRDGMRRRRNARRGVSRDFEDFLELLERNQVEYLVVGGYAVAFHSTPRYTKDIDILVRAARKNATRVLAAISEFAGPPDVSAERLARPDLVLMMGLPPTRIDVLTSIDGCDFARAWRRRVRGRYGSQEVWFIGRKDLIAAKKAAAREQDLLDLKRLERAARLGARG
ncbi:MAG: hypothetical protein HY720_29395 [Planctomycetes bacterium]|nr:hypothetical protein [Planctomycetota bacterium]